MAARISELQAERPKPVLRLLQAPKTTLFDGITRLSIMDRVRTIARSYKDTRIVLEQATFDVPGLDFLQDEDLIALHRDMERARECLVDGIPFDEAGLIRNLSKPEW